MFTRLMLALALAAGPPHFGLSQSRSVEPDEPTRTAASSSASVFAVGERLTYDVSWRDFIVAGELTLEVKERTSVGGRDSYHVTAVAESVGLGALVYKVNDRYDSFIDAATLKPFRAEKHSRRGKKSKTTAVIMDQQGRVAQLTDGRPIDIPADTHDLAGLMYAIRTIDLRPGASHAFTLLEDEKLYSILVEPERREKVQTRAGTFEAVKVSVRVVENGKSNDKARLRLYVTNDARRWPVLLTADPKWGEVHVELTSATGGLKK